MKAPTFEEVVQYAKESGLLGKVPCRKFYDYYSKNDFQFHGVLMDWHAKMHEWAAKQKSSVPITAEEYAISAKCKRREELVSPEEIMRRVAMI